MVCRGPERFSDAGKKITPVAGSRVRDVDAVLRVVSEGDGTMLMKKHVDFEWNSKDISAV